MYFGIKLTEKTSIYLDLIALVLDREPILCVLINTKSFYR